MTRSLAQALHKCMWCLALLAC